MFEDKDLFVIVKPSGILSQGDGLSSPDMVSLLKGKMVMEAKREGRDLSSPPYLAVIHRLDRGVRGIMVYAKTKAAARTLSKDLQKGEFEKIYLAVVDQKEGSRLLESKDFIRLQSRILYDKLENISYLSKDEKGDISLLDYKVLEVDGDRALILIKLITGRKHQIRLQMTEISNGIRGDRKYHLNREIFKKQTERLALECISLSFLHPVTRERLKFQIEPEAARF